MNKDYKKMILFYLIINTKMLLNIPKNIDDPFYRYKRNSIEIEKLNKKNGIIQIKNLDIISKQLDRESEVITKFFRKKLGIPINTPS